MAHALIGLALVVVGVRQARVHYRRCLDLYLAAIGLQLAGVVLLVAVLEASGSTL